jgi:hypothetical protein
MLQSSGLHFDIIVGKILIRSLNFCRYYYCVIHFHRLEVIFHFEKRTGEIFLGQVNETITQGAYTQDTTMLGSNATSL